MKELKVTSQFKKDLKRIQNNPKTLQSLEVVLKDLRNEQPLPPVYKAHMLSGNFKGCMECHVENDFLLVWIDETTQTIKLVRLGSHAELFG